MAWIGLAVGVGLWIWLWLPGRPFSGILQGMTNGQPYRWGYRGQKAREEAADRYAEKVRKGRLSLLSAFTFWVTEVGATYELSEDYAKKVMQKASQDYHEDYLKRTKRYGIL